MINRDLKNTKFIFDKMKKLYPNFEMPDEIDVQVWTEILEGYSQTDILDALKNYRKNVPYNVAPLPAKFKEYLPQKGKHEQIETTAVLVKGDFAWEQMERDIEAGNCRNNLYIYREAERIILNEWLVEYLPVEVLRKMGYAGKLQRAQEKGLLSNFSEALRQAAQRLLGRDYELQSKNDLKTAAQKRTEQAEPLKKTYGNLASHWRV